MGKYIERKALLNALKEERKNGNFVFSSKWIKEIMDGLPTTDVVPKSEVDRLEQAYNARLAKDIETNADFVKYAKREVAREIFEDLKKFFRPPMPECQPICIIRESELAELKKKYTEGNDANS